MTFSISYYSPMVQTVQNSQFNLSALLLLAGSVSATLLSRYHCVPFNAEIFLNYICRLFWTSRHRYGTGKVVPYSSKQEKPVTRQNTTNRYSTYSYKQQFSFYFGSCICFRKHLVRPGPFGLLASSDTELKGTVPRDF